MRPRSGEGAGPHVYATVNVMTGAHRAEVPPRWRRFVVPVAAAVAAALIAGTSAAVALQTAGNPAAPNQVMCPVGTPLVVQPDGTWGCGTAPTPSDTGTPTVEPTTPTPDPTTSSPTPDPTTSSPTPDPTTTSPTPTPTGCPVAGVHAPGASDGMGGCWPGPGNTGVPAGTTLSTYTGPSTITVAGTRITERTTGSLTIRAAGVVIERSQINGLVTVDSGDVTIVDSLINASTVQRHVVSGSGFTLRRVEVRGGNSSAWCVRCTIEDSWLHDQRVQADWHASGVRMDRQGVIRHNTIACDARDTSQGGGCSAGLSGYGDFDPVQDNIIDRNLFISGQSGFCAYGGSSKGKPYTNQTSDIRFTGNVFQRGPGGKCGFWGPITDFAPSRPGNVWSGNIFDNGVVVPPA